MKSRVVLTAAAAGFLCAQAMAASPATTGRPAVPAADPWAKVPALPTVCYSDHDPWLDKNNAALEAVAADLEHQNGINTAIDQQLSANPMAMAQAMQQAMMNDPQNARKYMEKVQQVGQKAQTETPEQLDKEHRIEEESKTVIGQYQAALDKAYAPASARWEAARKKLGLPPGTPMGLPDPSWPQWAWDEWRAIRRLQDTLYVANCATWWSATGPIHAYLKRYKDFLVQERIPFYKKLNDEPKVDNYRLLNMPMQGWRTTTDYKAVQDYMRMADKVFGERYSGPLCRPEGC